MNRVSRTIATTLTAVAVLTTAAPAAQAATPRNSVRFDATSDKATMVVMSGASKATIKRGQLSPYLATRGIVIPANCVGILSTDSNIPGLPGTRLRSYRSGVVQKAIPTTWTYGKFVVTVRCALSGR